MAKRKRGDRGQANPKKPAAAATTVKRSKKQGAGKPGKSGKLGKPGKRKSKARSRFRLDAPLDTAHYSEMLHALQIELVKLQNSIIRNDQKLLIIIEGRDAGGKDGAIKRITEHLSPREMRVVALSKPSDREQGAWYFQRHVAHLPTAGEIVLFNRSWYNRAGVERVMRFCSDEEYEGFFETVNPFEHMLIDSGVKLLKYYLDLSKGEQKKRLADRKNDPLKQWKLSPIDAVANEKWDAYSKARNIMFARSHTPWAPWTVVSADDKRLARLNLIKDILMRCDYKGKDETICMPDPHIVFSYDESCLENGLITP